MGRALRRSRLGKRNWPITLGGLIRPYLLAFQKLNVSSRVLVEQETLSRYRQDKTSALKLLSVGEMKPDPKIDPVELAAWTTVARVILNMDETITKQ